MAFCFNRPRDDSVSPRKVGSPGMNPFLVVIFAYVVGIALCAVCAVSCREKDADRIREHLTGRCCLGAAARNRLVFLLAYRGLENKHDCRRHQRRGHIALIPIGVVMYKDHLSWRNGRSCILHFGLAMVMRVSRRCVRLGRTEPFQIGAQPSRLPWPRKARRWRFTS